jgi:hypothetical protein
MCVILHQGIGGRGFKSLNCLKSLKSWHVQLLRVQGSMLRVQLPAAFKVQCFAFLLRSSQLRFKAYRSIAAR